MRKKHRWTRSFTTIIDGLGGSTTLAREIQVPASRVKKWKARDNIPAYAWPDVIALAASQDKTLSLNTLLRLTRRWIY